MPRPVHFEIYAADPARAQRFYETVFGWTFAQWGDQDYWIITTGNEGPGVNGGMLPRQGPDPAPDGPVSGYVMTTEVPNLDATIASIEGVGGAVVLPKNHMPGVGWLAYYRDTEGNLFGILQGD
ncbi:glyoxalase [Saccharothrix sp. ALI-22-I]|uniref:VOC family protein n=1 Tax=Saccharothrix sp. ALI-22-I TaxID=1933778 RepID=UPI00097BEF73|nr:VOC family protein [Saccharothrix sp. ALI-22-I]ONI89438.1 glyoxalase [Saccharothrix sp. ALI-22-I]